jgi:MSHA biogenesis protein MshG
MKYHYQGRNKEGQLIRGVGEGSSEEELASKLLRTGITPLSIALILKKANPLQKVKDYLESREPSTEDLVFFSQQMYSLTKAGVPLVKAIAVVAESSKNAELKIALREVVESLQSGHALAISMTKHPKVFTELMRALIQVGENSGGLETVFQQMAVYFEREAITRRRIKEVLRYPTTVLVVVIIAMMVVNVLVLPVFDKFFSEYNAKLPLVTQILMSTSKFILNYWILILLSIISSGYLLFGYFKTPLGRYQGDQLKLNLPLIGSILNRTILARFARSFALCMRAGVSHLHAIKLVANTLENKVLEGKILGMCSHIEHGESLIASATVSEIFTPLVLQMLSVGEETGEVDRLLDEVADYYEQEVDYEIKRLGDAMEPFLLLLIGFIVLVLALGVYLPMWDISSALFGKNT